MPISVDTYGTIWKCKYGCGLILFSFDIVAEHEVICSYNPNRITCDNCRNYIVNEGCLMSLTKACTLAKGRWKIK